ncbi:MAG: glycosyltransferase family 2 protein [Bdellovibrionales bacterium]|nr:glycosyltransferase family 2 protein [Bdellovibrionales bacterium]
MIDISVTVPLYNEEENVVHLYQELSSVMKAMQCEYELIFVDDGSKDKTVQNLARISRNDSNVRIVEFRRNFGQTAAMAAGLEHAQGSIVITMDGDLQNDPSEIPQMVAKLKEGYDLVAGWRKNRQDKLISRKLPSRIANKIISKLTRVKLHDYGCSLKVMTKEVAKGIKLYGEMHRFIPALAAEMGAKIAEVPVNHRARQFGTSKYGISRTLRVILDLITVKFFLGYSKRPIHLFGTIGLLSGIFGSATLALITAQKVFWNVPMGNRPLLALGVMLVLIGIQFLVFGLLAEVLARTYYESQNKRIYSVRRYIEPGRKNNLYEGDISWNKQSSNS